MSSDYVATTTNAVTENQSKRRIDEHEVHAMNGRELLRAAPTERANLSDDPAVANDQEDLRRWAEMVAGCLAQPVATTPAILGLGRIESEGSAPAGWRPSVGGLTPGEQLSSGVSGAPSVGRLETADGSEDLNRLQVRINTEEYGELSLVVERAAQGLRISLGAMDGRVVDALRLESASVRRALENGGQTVGSFEIVRMNVVGTDLAQGRMTPGNRARRTREPEHQEANPSERKKKTRRINLIG